MRSRLVYPALLALPFLAGIAVLKGLTVEIDTFHGSDARVYHLPTILQFAHQLPGVNLRHYPAAQTPLFHLVFAVWGKLVGFELWKLRLLNVAVSYGAVLVLFRLLVWAAGLREVQAFALALVFGLSPYFFGASFTLLTDNLAILFALLALCGFERFRRDGRLAPFALGALAMGAAVLTRQSFLWLALVGAAVLAVAPAPWERKAAGAAVGALVLVPFAALVATWHGLVPPGSDPASCGLCASRPGPGGGGLRAAIFGLALLGLYAVVIYAPVVVRWARESGLELSWGARVVGTAAVALAVYAVVESTRLVPRAGDAGYLWQVAGHLGAAGSSLFLLGLAVLGILALFELPRAGPLPLGLLVGVAFLLSTLAVRLVYQKYFDPFVLLTLMLLARREDLRRPLDYAGVAALGAGFVAYALSFAG